MKKIQHLLLTSLISVIYFCKKESKENKAINNDNRIVVIDSRAVKRLTKEENDKTYTEIKNTKTSRIHAAF
ncbi:hypothetical protein [Chryseobacterium sp. StRB126]|uniref:hypothetical protein n=1 Tax=Chryseobacterium sp. StRB126 TaxID=878220 RepID=UPI0011873E6D|nr:hypothetical protein [Chryseobacterium sp. StRB126]